MNHGLFHSQDSGSRMGRSQALPNSSRTLPSVSRTLPNVSRALHNNLKKVFLERSKTGSKESLEKVSNVVSPFVNYSRANCIISHKALNDISTPDHKSVEHEF